ncbi:MAG: Maf family protein [Parashewanella sp.]
MKKIILASSSESRKSILSKLQLPFFSIAPDVDETAKPNETATELVERLSKEKALAGAQLTQEPDALFIGSDQVCVIEGNIIGKPLTKENAIKQLMNASGKCITFYTGVAVYDSSTKSMLSSVEPFHVHFKLLSEQQITAYVAKENPLWCAGSFKSEGLGITLFERLEGDDPNTLVGLPLIRVTEFFSRMNLEILQ